MSWCYSHPRMMSLAQSENAEILREHQQLFRRIRTKDHDSHWLQQKVCPQGSMCTKFYLYEWLFIQMSFNIFNLKLLCAFQEGEDKAINVSAPLAKGRLFQTVEGVSLKASLYAPNRKLVLIFQLLDIFIFFMEIK